MVLADKTRLAYWVDAFANEPFRGNAAVVVPHADGLTNAQMQDIAREVNCSETAFVLPPTVPDADFRLRWFTPTLEVDLCGHATIATLHALCQAQLFALHPGTTRQLSLETRSGVLGVTVDYTQPRPWIWLTLPSCRFEAIAPDLTQQLVILLGLTYPDPSVSAVLDSHNRDVFIAAESLHQLQTLTPYLEPLKHFGLKQGWRGFCVYTRETVEPDNHAHSRFFAPQSGIDEDPVTGSMSGPLALLLQQGNPAQNQWRFEQGDCLGRAGRVAIELQDNIPKLGGQAITVMRGELYL